LHYNLNITDPPTIPEGTTYANALWNASDQLPVRVDIRLPARIALAPAALDFGTVIVGAAVSKSLAVSNPALAPAEVLSYSPAASARSWSRAPPRTSRSSSTTRTPRPTRPTRRPSPSRAPTSRCRARPRRPT